MMLFVIFSLSLTECLAMERAKKTVEDVHANENFKVFVANFNKDFEILDWPVEKKSDLLMQLIMKYKCSSIEFDPDVEVALTKMNIIDSEKNIIKKDYIGIIFAQQIAETGFIHPPQDPKTDKSENRCLIS